MKNCGSLFHIEVATKQFMDDLHDVLKQTTDVNVRDEILRLVQVMAHAFRNESSYRAVGDKMKYMKAEGFQFPVLKESDAMFSADTAPEWSDGECCHRCRVQFTMLVRKHHCRHCGQVFCASCSAKTSTIPKFGIEKEVRVCDVCYDKINKRTDGKPSLQSDEHKAKPATTSAPASTTVASSATTTPAKKSEQEIREEEELQLAIALSKSEAEIKERERMRYSQFTSTPSAAPVGSNGATSTSKHSKKSSKSPKATKTSKKSSKVEGANENEDPEMARYLNRDYWEQRTNTYADYEPSPSPSAPQPIPTSSVSSTVKTTNADISEPKVFQDKLSTAPTDNDELEGFTNSLRSTIEIFVNRLNSNKLRGRPITNDNGVQSLFMNLTNLHSQLIMYTQQTNEARTNSERLQDKISQIRDARAALDALREEHREQMRRAAEEAERIRQQQMAQKLEIMRQKKQEYLQYQREMALQRMHEQEREMMMRQEQFKFASQNPAAAPMVAPPQWSNVPNMAPNGYYVPNVPAFANTMPSQPTIGGGQYVQSSLPNGSGMVASHHGPMPRTSSEVPGQPQTQTMPQQVMPQYGGPQNVSMPPSNMYIPQMAGNYQPEGPPPGSQHPPNQQYPMVAQPQAAPAPVPLQVPPMPQQAPEANESQELLINFD